MSVPTIRIRILKRCMLSASEIAEPGQIVALSVDQAANLLGYGGGEAVDPAQAKAAIDAWNLAAYRSGVASQPRPPHEPLGWLAGGRFH